MHTLFAYRASADRHCDVHRTFVWLHFSCPPALARDGAQGTPDSKNLKDYA
jgi:hypothetical protein